MQILTWPSGADVGRCIRHAFVAGLAVCGRAAAGRPAGPSAAPDCRLPARQTLRATGGAPAQLLSPPPTKDSSEVAQAGQAGEAGQAGQPRQLTRPAKLVRQRADDRWRAVGDAARDLAGLLHDLLPGGFSFGQRLQVSADLLGQTATRAEKQARRAAMLIRRHPMRPADDLSRQLAGLAGTRLHELRQVLPHVGGLTAYPDSIHHSQASRQRRPDMGQWVGVLMRLRHGP